MTNWKEYSWKRRQKEKEEKEKAKAKTERKHDSAYQQLTTKTLRRVQSFIANNHFLCMDLRQISPNLQPQGDQQRGFGTPARTARALMDVTWSRSVAFLITADLQLHCTGS